MTEQPDQDDEKTCDTSWFTPSGLTGASQAVVFQIGSFAQAPENPVRWVVRGGEKVLQQAWIEMKQDQNGYMTKERSWRDVPVETE